MEGIENQLGDEPICNVIAALGRGSTAFLSLSEIYRLSCTLLKWAQLATNPTTNLLSKQKGAPGEIKDEDGSQAQFFISWYEELSTPYTRTPRRCSPRDPTVNSTPAPLSPLQALLTPFPTRFPKPVPVSLLDKYAAGTLSVAARTRITGLADASGAPVTLPSEKVGNPRAVAAPAVVAVTVAAPSSVLAVAVAA